MINPYTVLNLNQYGICYLILGNLPCIRIPGFQEDLKVFLATACNIVSAMHKGVGGWKRYF